MKLTTMRRRKNLVNITPLIDVVFMLLVFFMLAGSIEPDDAFPVAPPVSDATIKGDVQDLVILVDRAGNYAIDDQAMSRGAVVSTVRAIMFSRPGTLIQIKADGGTDAVAVIELMEDLRGAGVEYLVLLTVGPGGPGS